MSVQYNVVEIDQIKPVTNCNELLKKIENMPAEELSQLVCDALDESGVKYERGKSNINFNGLPVD